MGQWVPAGDPIEKEGSMGGSLAQVPKRKQMSCLYLFIHVFLYLLITYLVLGMECRISCKPGKCLPYLWNTLPHRLLTKISKLGGRMLF